MRRLVPILLLILGAPVTATAAGTIDNIVVTPTPPVESNADVTITTDFTTTSGIDAFTTQVTKTPGQVTVDVLVDESLSAVIDNDTSVANVGTFQPGDVACVVNLHTAQSPPPYDLSDSVACDFTVVSTLPGLSGWALVLAGAIIAAIGSLRLAMRRRWAPS